MSPNSLKSSKVNLQGSDPFQQLLALLLRCGAAVRAGQKGDKLVTAHPGHNSQYKAILSPDGQSVRLIGTLTDISMQIDREQELRKQAQQDPLTGLYKRMLSSAKVSRALEVNSRLSSSQLYSKRRVSLNSRSCASRPSRIPSPACITAPASS